MEQVEVRLVGGGPCDGEVRLVEKKLKLIRFPTVSSTLFGPRIVHSYVRKDESTFKYEGTHREEVAK